MQMCFGRWSDQDRAMAVSNMRYKQSSKNKEEKIAQQLSKV